MGRSLLRVLEAARHRMPEDAGSFLDCLACALQEAAAVQGDRAEAAEDLKLGSTHDEASSSHSGEEDTVENGEGTPFSLGPNQLPLAVLLSIANGLEPDDLTPAAAACKSLCIAININLQYMYFLRLLRLIVLGPEMARAMRDQE